MDATDGDRPRSALPHCIKGASAAVIYAVDNYRACRPLQLSTEAERHLPASTNELRVVKCVAVTGDSAGDRGARLSSSARTVIVAASRYQGPFLGPRSQCQRNGKLHPATRRQSTRIKPPTLWTGYSAAEHRLVRYHKGASPSIMDE